MLYSDWLLNMLEKAGSDPRSRILALFDILHDWTTAPGIGNGSATRQLSHGAPDALLAYLSKQLAALRLEEPEVLAQQVVFIALGALQAEKAGTHGAFAQGRNAVSVLLDAQRKPTIARARMAAVTASACLIAFAAFFVPSSEIALTRQAVAVETLPVSLGTTMASLHPAATSLSSSPDQMASLHDSLERIRQGVCQYPQALMLAPEYRAVYLDNVVNGSVPGSADQMREARQLAKKVECYYPPVAMTM